MYMRLVLLAVAGILLAGCSTLMPKFKIHEADARFLEKGTLSQMTSENNFVAAPSWTASSDLYLNPMYVTRVSGDKFIGFEVKAYAYPGPARLILIADGKKIVKDVGMDSGIFHPYGKPASGLVSLMEDDYCRIATARELTVNFSGSVIENDQINPKFRDNLLIFHPQCRPAAAAGNSADNNGWSTPETETGHR